MQNLVLEESSVNEENEEVLKIMAYMILKKLQKIYERKERKILLIQRKNNIVKNEKGIPIDRPGWFWLPFMKELSREFQPREIKEKEVKIYQITPDFFEGGVSYE